MDIDNFRRAALAEELAVLRQVDEFAVKGLSPPRGKNGFARYFFMNFHRFLSFPRSLFTSFRFRASSLSPNARMARISSLENMLGISSNSLVAMASQLSEAEERERAFTNRGRWNQLRSMGDAKNLLQYMFNSLAETRYLDFPTDKHSRKWFSALELVNLQSSFSRIFFSYAGANYGRKM